MKINCKTHIKSNSYFNAINKCCGIRYSAYKKKQFGSMFGMKNPESSRGIFMQVIL